MLTVKGRPAVKGPDVFAVRAAQSSCSSKAVSSGRGASGLTIQYEGTPNLSYAAFFRFRSTRAVLGDRISTTSSGGLVNFCPADLIHAHHNQVRIELGLRAELHGRLGYDAQVIRAGATQDAVQPSRHDLVDGQRGYIPYIPALGPEGTAAAIRASTDQP
jgi:hypothetical protein